MYAALIKELPFYTCPHAVERKLGVNFGCKSTAIQTPDG